MRSIPLNNGMRAVASVFFICVAARLAAGEATPPAPPQPPQKPANQQIVEGVYAKLKPEDERGYQRLGPPKRGEWRALVNEAPQTFEDYQQSAVRPNENRRAIVLQPLGDFSDTQRETVGALKEYIEAFYMLPARVAGPLPLEARGEKAMLKRVIGHNPRGAAIYAYEARKILRYIMAKDIPGDAYLYLGVTAADIWSDDAGVFGMADLEARVGVISFHRLNPPLSLHNEAPNMFLRRACKTINHELGHALGLTHCVFFHCSMNGCNGLPEADSAPLHYCPVCEQKLAWNLGFDRARRDEALAAFYRKYHLDAEAGWFSNRK